MRHLRFDDGVFVTMLPQVLLPYDPREAATLTEAARYLKVSKRTATRMASTRDIGRRIDGRWLFSRVAMLLVMEGKPDALTRYLAGDRQSDDVVQAFARFGIVLG